MSKSPISKGSLVSAGDVQVYSYMGPVHCSICAPGHMPRDQVEAEVNVINPTGIDSPWTISDASEFRSGQPNPCPCEAVDGRLHYLMVC